MTPAPQAAPDAPFVATLLEHEPTALGRVVVTVSAPSRDDASRSVETYSHRWQRYAPTFHAPVEGIDRVWRATGHRAVQP